MANSRRARVLFIDDALPLHFLVRRVLSASGVFEVTTCASGQEGVEVAPMLRPDLILVDFEMPEMNGVETLRALRRLRVCTHIPAFFFTSEPGKLSPRDVAETEAVAVLAKTETFRLHLILEDALGLTRETA